MRLTVRRRLVSIDGMEPLLVTEPGEIRHVVVMFPAPTEPRCGRYGGFAQWAALWAGAGVASVVSDLPGGGDSLTRATPSAWLAQRHTMFEAASQLAHGNPVHEFARGAGCALLSDATPVPGVRIALSPPTAEECGRVARLAHGPAPDQVPNDDFAYTVAAASSDADLDPAIGPLLEWAAERLSGPRWDLELHVARRQARAESSIVFGDMDPLLRLEVTRAGVGHVLREMFDELSDPQNWQ